MSVLTASRDPNWIACVDFGTALSKLVMVESVDRADLKTLTGLRAAVRYSESGGHTTVESVNVFDTSERNPR